MDGCEKLTIIEIHIPSVDNQYLLQTYQNVIESEVADLLRQYNVEVRFFIHRNNRLPLTVLYNNILDEVRKKPTDDLKNTVVIFLHSDVVCSIKNIVLTVLSPRYNKYSIFGLAGASVLQFKNTNTPLSWYTCSANITNARHGIISSFYNNRLITSNFSNAQEPYVVECKAIDGLCIILTPAAILSNIKFDDKRFSNHFYDFDFCLTAQYNQSKKLKIACINEPTYHASVGAGIASIEYQTQQIKFIEKWGIKPNTI